MNLDYSLDVFFQGLRVLVLLVLPILLGVGVVSFLLSSFQAVTSVRDQALSYVGRVVAVFITIYVLSPFWIEAIQELAQLAWNPQ